MKGYLHTKKIIFIGGDRREIELYRLWRDEGLLIKVIGFENSPLIDHAEADDLALANVVITPLSGITTAGTVTAAFASESPLPALRYLGAPEGKYLLLSGSVAPEVMNALPDRAQLVLTADDPELALLNAVPTAEGAIQKAIELSEITLHNSRVLVIGLGRCGLVLARMLQGIGANVTAVVRRNETAALAFTMGIKSVYQSELSAAINEMDFIYNTAPAPVLNAAVLKKVKAEALILDLASAPGGTDFKSADALGIKALLLPGLPGKVAPRTAARILSQVYRRLIVEL